MSRTAKYVKDIVIQDPDTGGDVEVTLFKHESGGIFGIDASWIDQVAEEDELENPMCNDPLADLDDTDRVVLIWPRPEKKKEPVCPMCKQPLRGYLTCMNPDCYY